MATAVKKKRRKDKRATKAQKSRVVDEQKKREAVDAITGLALGSKHVRRELANVSVKFFAQYYFDITLGNHQVRWIEKLARVKKGLVLAPCGHGKTEVFSKILLLWLIVRNRDVRILLCSKSDGLAVKNLKSIKFELTENQKLIADYGRFYNNTDTWSTHQLYCIRNKNMKDPTVEAVGLLGAITGGRFDVLVLDDVLDVLNTRTEDQREKVRDYIDGTLIPRLEPWGVTWGVGTRKHFDDYYAHCIENPTWVVIENQAIIREPEEWVVHETDEPMILEDSLGEKHETYFRVEITSEDKGECLWPDKWSMENLLLLRYTIGTLVFEREYQNRISSDEFALFKIGDLQKARDRTLSYVSGEFHDRDTRREYLGIVMGYDPSLVDDKRKAEAGDTDYSVITTWAVDENYNRVLLGLKRVRGISPGAAQKLLEDEYHRFLPDLCFIESNAFGTIHANILINEKGINITKHHTDRKKTDLYVGVPGMSVTFENGKVRLPYKTQADKELTDQLVKEFHGLGIEKHDDIVMSTWIAWTGVERWLKGLARTKRNVTRVKKPNRVKQGVRK